MWLAYSHCFLCCSRQLVGYELSRPAARVTKTTIAETPIKIGYALIWGLVTFKSMSRRVYEYVNSPV